MRCEFVLRRRRAQSAPTKFRHSQGCSDLKLQTRDAMEAALRAVGSTVA